MTSVAVADDDDLIQSYQRLLDEDDEDDRSEPWPHDNWLGPTEPDLTDVQENSGGYGTARGFGSLTPSGYIRWGEQLFPYGSRRAGVGMCALTDVDMKRRDRRAARNLITPSCETPNCPRPAKHFTVPRQRPKVARDSCERCNQYFRNHGTWPTLEKDSE